MTRLIHRVSNVPTWWRWGVPLANRFFIGFQRRQHEGLRAEVLAIGARLSCAAYLEGR